MISNRNYTPPRPSGSGSFYRFCQAVWDRVFGPESNFIDSETIKWEQGTRGIIARAQVRPGGGNPTLLKTYRVKAVAGDTLLCVTWDGVTEGTDNVFVAKSFESRQPASEVIAGVTVNYTYSDGPDEFNDFRQATGTGIDEQQIVIPYWREDGEILVARTNYSGVLDDNDRDIKLIEVSARCWAGPAT